MFWALAFAISSIQLTQLVVLDGASKDAQNPSFTLFFFTLFIDGKGTTHKDKYKYTILTGKQFEETFENAQWRKV